MVTRRTMLVGTAIGGAALLAAGVGVTASYAAAIDAANKRVSTATGTIATRFGALEYADVGTGTPLLMIHGTGGGYDQGLGFAAPLIAAGYRIISPSRFGYLGSAFPPDPSTNNQADALVELLDHLGIDKLAVAGGSAGALPAIAFAIRHPDRCAGLIAIVPAIHVPGRPITPGPTGFAETAMTAMLHSDFLFWTALHTARDLMIGTMLATDPAVLATTSAAEQARVHDVLWNILPVSRRANGLLNDAALASTPAPMALEQITVPTLAISVEDDRFGTAAAARHLASVVPGTKLVIYPSGGHIWAGHNEALFAEVAAFVDSLPA